ncbi:MAG: hypothetical protein QNJ29_11745 [Rhizobiaceae bacterium]|nr:hypothetical protein [Rhizobiaceae bacterium]
MVSLSTVLVSVILGGIAGFISAYIGPKKLEEWRQEKHNREWAEPRRELLRQLLSDPRWRFRNIAILSRVAGVNEEQCRDLLISIKARGIANTKSKEQWALISRAPLEEVEKDNDD